MCWSSRIVYYWLLRLTSLCILVVSGISCLHIDISLYDIRRNREWTRVDMNIYDILSAHYYKKVIYQLAEILACGVILIWLTYIQSIANKNNE